MERLLQLRSDAIRAYLTNPTQENRNKVLTANQQLNNDTTRTN